MKFARDYINKIIEGRFTELEKQVNDRLREYISREELKTDIFREDHNAHAKQVEGYLAGFNHLLNKMKLK